MKNLRADHPWLVRIVKTVLVAIGITAFLLAIAQDQETVKVRSAVAAEDPDAADYLATLVASNLVAGNSYEVLVNGDQAFPAMLDAIAHARQRVSFETFVYEDGQVANQFTNALEKAARRGVTVYVILDAVGARSIDTDHVKRLRAAGCTIVNFNPTSWYTLEDVNYRTHRKILVVDGTVGFTGGLGVADHWLGDAQDAKHWRDTHVLIRGPIVRLLEGAFYENLIEGDETATPVLTRVAPVAGTNDKSMVVRSSPSDGASDLKRLYLLAIAMARQSVDITSPYFVTDESTTWAFKDALARGVKVRILVEGEITDQKPVKYASRAAYDDLLASGIDIYEYVPTMMHTKTLVVDGVLSIFGSANFDNRSLELNDEVNIAALNRQLADKFIRDFEKDLRESRKLTVDTWRKRPFMERAHEQFWSYFDEVF